MVVISFCCVPVPQWVGAEGIAVRVGESKFDLNLGQVSARQDSTLSDAWYFSLVSYQISVGISRKYLPSLAGGQVRLGMGCPISHPPLITFLRRPSLRRSNFTNKADSVHRRDESDTASNPPFRQIATVVVSWRLWERAG